MSKHNRHRIFQREWRALSMLIALLAPPLFAASTTDTGTDVPSQFVHDQVWVTPRLGGHELRLFTDTGGGWNALSMGIARRHGMKIIEDGSGGEPVRLVAFPAFDKGAGIPAPPDYFRAGRLILGDDEQLVHMDGFLGARWFADSIWEFDYPAQRLRKLKRAPDMATECIVKLGFQMDDSGKRTMHFPSMQATIDGEVLDVLLDTGATATLTERSGEVFKLPDGTKVATSFIEHEVFERWVQRHPEWRVIDDADRKGEKLWRMIEVPVIEIAGQAVGPVWFAEQPPGAFQKYMASMMDRPTWGALGGSAFKYFRIVIDYPRAQACFLRAPR